MTLNLKKPVSKFCSERLQLSTAFDDQYHSFFKKGPQTLELKYRDLRDIIDIHQNGLRVFTFCSGPFEVLSSTYMTSLLWTGGEGTSPHLPVFGTMPTTYQVDGNTEFLKSFSGRSMKERIIQEVHIDYDMMETGDILVSRRWTGFPTAMMILSGGFASQVAMIKRDAN